MTEHDTDGEKLLLSGARVVLPERVAAEASLLVEGGLVARVFEGAASAPAAAGARTLDLRGHTLYPGFVDLHIHGALGSDILEASADDLHRVARFLAARGVTAWLPTLVPAPAEDYERAARAVEELMRTEDARPAAARALGLHYEGPFVNSAQCGALRTRYFRTFGGASDIEDLAVVRAPGAAHMMTLAPEVTGGVALARELASRGWVVSVGHTRADLDTLEAARAAGARHMTHFMNAMSPLHHRAPGPVGWGLLRDDVTVDVIADGVHLAPEVLSLVLRCKGANRVALISDAVAPAGMGDGEFRVWGESITVADGRTQNARGSIAGSVITMHDAARTMLALGTPESDVARMASLNPARLLGLERHLGSIEEGKRADLAAFGPDLRPSLTLVGGRVAFEK